MKSRLLPRGLVLDRIGISKTQLYRLIKAGEFPEQVSIGEHRVAWLESEIDQWIERRVSLRDRGASAKHCPETAISVVEGTP